MKNILKITCLILVLFAVYFPFSYFGKALDKKEIKVSHILVDTQEEAIQIKKDLNENKKSFEDMAKEHSKCPSAEDGGDLGYNEHGRLVKDFENTAFNLPFNKVSEPVKTANGWHLIKVYNIKYFSDKENFSRRYYADTKDLMKLLNK